METERPSGVRSWFSSILQPFGFNRKRSQYLRPPGRQLIQERVAAPGQQSSSNRILSSAARTWTPVDGRAKLWLKKSTQDNTNTRKDSHEVESTLGTNRQVSQNAQTVRQVDETEGRQVQIRALKHALEDRNTTIKEYKGEQTEHQDRLQQLESRHELLASGKAEAEDALQKMSTKAELLQSQLRECKDDLFRLQPLNEISDSTILRQYEILSQQIDSWVDDLFSHIDDENAYRERSGRTPHPLIKTNSNPQDFLASSPNASGYFLRHWLHSCLQQEVFVEGVYLSCVPGDYVSFIEVIEKSMRALEPRRDSTTIDIWRSETLAALANHPHMKDLRSVKALDLAEQIHESFMSATPEACEEHESLHALKEKIVIPAMELALNIQLTSGRYYFYPRTGLVPPAERRLTFERISEHTMIDMSTRRTLKDNSPVMSADDGTIGEKIFVLEPGLVRRGRGGNPDVLMRKVVYLVKLDRPLGKRPKRAMSGPKDVITLEYRVDRWSNEGNAGAMRGREIFQA